MEAGCIGRQNRFLTHYWLDDRFPEAKTVTKVSSSDLNKLIRWGAEYGLKPEWIHHKNEFPHFDLLGETQRSILEKERLTDHLKGSGCKKNASSAFFFLTRNQIPALLPDLNM